MKKRTFGVCISTLAALCIWGCSPEKTQEKEPPVFTQVPSSSSGITFRNDLSEGYDTWFDMFAYVYNGGGVAIGDINNDGLSDIYFTGNEVDNKLYLNKGGLKFEDITNTALVGGNGKWNNGVTMVDINGDGLLDIYVCKGGWGDTEQQRRNLLFVNQGDLTFKEQAADYGLDESGYSIHASFFDMDNDNDLDVYVTNRPDSFDLPLSEMVRQKKLSPSTSRDKLYVNDNQKFKEVGQQAGIVNNFGYALSVVTSDLNNDGFTDIYVANDFAESDYMYVNQGNGTFKEQIRQATNHISMYSMGTDVADINNDGLEDIMVTEMLPEDYKRSKVSMPSMDVEGFYNIVNAGMHKQYMHNALHLNQGNGFFSDVSQVAGVTKTEWSWAVLLSDFDNDGDRDVYVANGYKRDVFDGDIHHKIAALAQANMEKYSTPEEFMANEFKQFINLYQPIKVTDYLFRNEGDLQFSNVSNDWGIIEPSFSNGAAVGDLDGDGDLELIINTIDDEAMVYENKSAANYLKVKLEGPPGNSSGIGAKITLHYSGQIQYFENKTVRGYLSSNDPVAHFGLGSTGSIDSVVVVWPDQKKSVTSSVNANQQLAVKWADAKPVNKGQKSVALIAEAALINPTFVHRENVVNEYKDQVLLPHGFSRAGPFLSVGDVNGDQQEDFYVGGAKGQAGALYLQSAGKFALTKSPAFEKDKDFEDAESRFFDADGDKDLDLYVASGGSEEPDGSEKYQDRLYVNDGKGGFQRGSLPKTASSGSCVVTFDIDGDGDLDIFRGGQVIVGRYPKIPRSYVLVNEGGSFVDKTREVAPLLQEPGLVKSAVATDLNGDQKPELIVVGEWMPIRIFSGINGKLEEVTAEYIDKKTEGWWSEVTADDIDSDGDMDLLVGNIGENYKFRASDQKPFHVYASDFDNSGTNDVFLARYLPDSSLVPIRGRECTSQQMPVIAQKFPTYLAFANSDLAGILGEGMDKALHYKAHLFSSVILVNENGKLIAQRLPVESQLSCINGFLINDFDGDGKKDILLAGNKFDVEVETTQADASPGLFLKGMGGNSFKPLKSFESGFFVPYNVKDIKLVKVGDGWAILVASNDDVLRIFRIGSFPPGTLALR